MSGKATLEFGGRIRIRACGICFQGSEILLLNHFGLYNRDFWAPPGGGVNFGEKIEDTLKREFEEECNTIIKVNRFLFGCEFVNEPLHAIELFYEVENMGPPSLGGDPEMADHQVISGLKFMTEKDLDSLSRNHLHGIFKRVKNPLELKQLSGFFTIT